MMTPVVSKGNLRTECCRNKSENLERSFFFEEAQTLLLFIVFVFFYLFACLFWGVGVAVVVPQSNICVR